MDNPAVLEERGVYFSRHIQHADLILQKAWPGIQSDFFDETGKDLFLTCSWRSVSEQMRLYAQGRTAPGKIVTWRDGKNRVSKHNLWPAKAIDVCVDLFPGPKKKISWDWHDYVALTDICKRYGLTHGGSWTRKDWPHIEIPDEVA